MNVQVLSHTCTQTPCLHIHIQREKLQKNIHVQLSLSCQAESKDAKMCAFKAHFSLLIIRGYNFSVLIFPCYGIKLSIAFAMNMLQLKPLLSITYKDLINYC